MREVPEDAIEIGPNTWIVKDFNEAGEWVGVEEMHREPDGRLSCGYVGFRREGSDPAKTWVVSSLESLTLFPSVACASCSHHGWIRNGRWEPA